MRAAACCARSEMSTETTELVPITGLLPSADRILEGYSGDAMVVWVDADEEAVETASGVLDTVSSAIERSVKQAILINFLRKVTNNGANLKFAPIFAEQKRGRLVARDLGYYLNLHLCSL